MADISLSQAQHVIAAAIQKAQEINITAIAVIVDNGAHIKALERMDDSMLGCLDLAIRKAKTTKFFDTETIELGPLTQPGAEEYGLEISNGGLISFAGGVPLINQQGEILGAIGISGGSVDEDQIVAKHAAQQLLELTR